MLALYASKFTTVEKIIKQLMSLISQNENDFRQYKSAEVDLCHKQSRNYSYYERNPNDRHRNNRHGHDCQGNGNTTSPTAGAAKTDQEANPDHTVSFYRGRDEDRNRGHRNRGRDSDRRTIIISGNSRKIPRENEESRDNAKRHDTGKDPTRRPQYGKIKTMFAALHSNVSESIGGNGSE